MGVLSAIRGPPPLARPINRPISGPATAIILGPPGGRASNRPPQAFLAVAAAPSTRDPRAAPPSVGLALTGPRTMAPFTSVVPVQVPVGPLTGLACGPPSRVAPDPLPKPARVARRARAGRVGIRPGALSGVSVAPRALKGRPLPGHAVGDGRATLAARPARPTAPGARGRAFQVRVVPALKAALKALTPLAKGPPPP